MLPRTADIHEVFWPFAISAADDVIQAEKREGYLPSGKCRVSNRWLLNVRFEIVSTPR